MKFIGIDLHSNCFTVFIICGNGKKVKESYSLDDDSIRRFGKKLDKGSYVMLEASTNSFKFAELIKPLAKEVIIANPYKLKLISMTNKKTDHVDAEKLAIYLKMQVVSKEKLINPVYIPEQNIQELRSLFCTYKLLRKHIGATKNRIHSVLRQNLHPFTKQFIFGKKNRSQILNLELEPGIKFQLKFLFCELEHMENSIQEIEDRIHIVGSNYMREIDILTSMKGISVFTAIAIIADIATVKRFPNSKHFTSYLRSAPGVDSSNETTHITKTNKIGRKLSITLIAQSLNHFRDNNAKLNRWYNKKVENKSRGKVRMALCRRVFAEIYQMLKKGEYHYYRNELNHAGKMNEYCKFLDANGIKYKKSA